MTEKRFDTWRKAAGILFILMLLGFILAFAIPQFFEAIGIILILSGYFGGLVIASKVGFDNKSMWMGLTFLFPYILLPIMYFRKYEKVAVSAEKRAQQKWIEVKSILLQKVEKIIRLKNKSTLSSLMQAGRMSNEILDEDDNWQPLSNLALDNNNGVNKAARKEIIQMLFRIENNDFVDEIKNRLRNNSSLEIKNIIAELDAEKAELEDEPDNEKTT